MVLGELRDGLGALVAESHEPVRDLLCSLPPLSFASLEHTDCARLFEWFIPESPTGTGKSGINGEERWFHDFHFSNTLPTTRRISSGMAALGLAVPHSVPLGQ